MMKQSILYELEKKVNTLTIRYKKYLKGEIIKGIENVGFSKKDLPYIEWVKELDKFLCGYVMLNCCNEAGINAYSLYELTSAEILRIEKLKTQWENLLKLDDLLSETVKGNIYG